MDEIESDIVLLEYKTYEDYLDSLVTQEDHCYLQSSTISRTIAELGYRLNWFYFYQTTIYSFSQNTYRKSSETLSKEQFQQRLKAILLYLNPPYKPYKLSSENMKGNDSIHIALANRERPNRLGILSVKYSISFRFFFSKY